MTKFERKIWYALRGLRSRGFHFRRQAPFRGYYLDFVEHNVRLVVEVDGSQHFDSEGQAHDEVRDAVLRGERYLTLRFTNADVDENLDGVLEIIWEELQRRSGRPALPSI